MGIDVCEVLSFWEVEFSQRTEEVGHDQVEVEINPLPKVSVTQGGGEVKDFTTPHTMWGRGGRFLASIWTLPNQPKTHRVTLLAFNRAFLDSKD